MSGFIPMVSTTPPPIGDDDFGDFMVGTEQEEDEFGDFSSPVSYEECSYPSLCLPLDVTNSMSYSGYGEESPTKIYKHTENHELKGDNKEVEAMTVMSEEADRKHTVNSNSIEFQTLCNSKKRAAQKMQNGKIIARPPISIDSNDWLDFSAEPSESTAATNQDMDGAENDCQDPVKFSSSHDPANLKFENTCEVNHRTKFQSEKCDKPDSGLSSSEYEQSVETFADDEDVPENIIKQLSSDDNPVNAVDELPEADCHVKSDEEIDVKPCLSDGVISLESGFGEFSMAKYDVRDELGPAVAGAQNSSTAGRISADESSDSTHPNFASFTSARVNGSEMPCHQGSNADEQGATDNFNLSLQVTENFDANFSDIQIVCNSSGVEKDDFNSVTLSSNDVLLKKNPSDDFEATGQYDEFECDFGAFESNIKSSGDDNSFAAAKNTDSNQSPGDAEFGDFSSNARDLDDFGDFSSGSAPELPVLSTTVTKTLNLGEKVAKYLSKYSAGVESLSDSITHLGEHLSADDAALKDLDSPSAVSAESLGIVRPGDLWEQLEDIDNAIALKFLWNGSGHNKHLLNSLGMHTQNILFSGAKQAYYVPAYYAAGLGLVDTNKGILRPMSAAEKIAAICPTDKNPSSLKDEIIPEEPHPEWKTMAGEHDSRVVDGSWLCSDQIATASTLAGPKCDNSSDPVPIVSSLAMDLDLFSNLPCAAEISAPARNTDVIDPELLELASAPTIEPPPEESGGATLVKILASMKGENRSSSIISLPLDTTRDGTECKKEENKLSLDARSVLGKLPDLSYMRAKVLIFPMNMSRVKIGKEI